MKILTLVSGTVFLSMALSGAAYAGPGKHKHNYSYQEYARVIKVRPITEIVEVSTPRQECWTEHVTRHGHSHTSYTPEIVGGIIGAAVGNQFGGGSGRKVATAAGALLGGSIGRDYKYRRPHGGYHAYTEPVQRCETRHEYHSEERVVGYKVKYRYNGRVYHTRTDRHPGDRIPIRVNVTPAY
ncbi:MAG: glycine zipper 2TM domain-containing protein [Gammaproteobacteria bacterium]|nr:glycine zipper 2TM domain-containing protein [Gammaproteobacteria bacterium]